MHLFSSLGRLKREPGERNEKYHLIKAKTMAWRFV
jgi:hypothetical protein